MSLPRDCGGVDWCGDGSKPDPGTDNDARENQGERIGGQRREQRTDDEDDAGPDESGATSDAVGDNSADERASHGANQHDADDELFHLSRNRKGMLYEENGGGDDAHVVAVEDAAKGGNGADAGDQSAIYVRTGVEIRHGFTLRP